MVKQDYKSIVKEDLIVPCLGSAEIDSPLLNSRDGRPSVNFMPDSKRLLVEHEVDSLIDSGKPIDELPSFELAGPREKIYFDPKKVVAGIVTCGGLCPGINDVIRGLVMNLYYRYGVKNILGFQYGYLGTIEKSNLEPIKLTPDIVKDIHNLGGTILKSSRGRQCEEEQIDYFEKLGVNVLFVVGGDGSQRGGRDISEVVRKRGSGIAVVGIPKTIDNDIRYLYRSFGFETGVQEAFKAVNCAHTEAEGVPNGIGLVKLMGRRSGYIACHTALASGNANFVMIPEVPFSLKGENGLLECLRRRLEVANHACIIVAEGAGQDLMELDETHRDASGNVILEDIGLYLKRHITRHLGDAGVDHTVKYIDPSYIIRSVPATADDSLFCAKLAHNAVHAAMSGRTEMLVGTWRGRHVHFPIGLITSGRQFVETDGDIWQSVLEMTGQPREMK